MSGKKWQSPGAMRASVGTGWQYASGVWVSPEYEAIDLYEYHPPTKEEDEHGY